MGVIAIAAYAIGGWKLAAVTTFCLAVIVSLGLWNDAMVTLASTLLATVIVMLLGVVFGVAMGRSSRIDAAMRPMLDAGQAIKITADGIAAISPTVVEAAVSSGSTPWQVISKVQLPMARKTLALAANQGLMYVLAMVVIGALVGAGGLGYDVVAGFVQSSVFGKGLAAGLAIVFLGILLDRITQAAASTRGRKPGARRT